MRIFGTADKPKKYRESVKSETAKLEAELSKQRIKFTNVEKVIAARIEKENALFEKLKAEHSVDLQSLEIRKSSVAHQIKEAGSNFKATQTRLNELEAALVDREADLMLKERESDERAGKTERLEAEAAKLRQDWHDTLMSAQQMSAEMEREARQKLAIAETATKAVTLEAERVRKAMAYAEQLTRDANAARLRVNALEVNLVYREEELARKAKKLQSKEAALIAAQRPRV